jgi:hypothetical protein
MPDRIDIDALLIGALYGELTPADEALLAAHLESHPVDRTALDDLARTRAAVRPSRLLAVQVEPPHAISALLLQEASRRAPRPDPRSGETQGWFQRFVRSFMVHPAMAAAAMLVLVIGVAGTFYLRGTDQFAESSPPALRAQDHATVAKQEAAAPSGAFVPAGSATPAAPAPEPEVAAGGDRAAVGSGTGTAGYGVDLDDVSKNPLARARKDEPSADGDRSNEKRKAGDAPADRVSAQAQDEAQAQAPEAPVHAAPARSVPLAPPAKMARSDGKPSENSKFSEDKKLSDGKKLSGIIVNTPEMSPRELKEDDGLERDRRPAPVASATGRVTRGARPDASGGAAAQAPAPPPAPPPAAAPGAPSQDTPAFATGASDQKSAPVANKPAARPQSPPATTPPSNANNRLTKAADPAAKDAGPDRGLVDWARKQHEQVKTLVSSNNCRDAAAAATEIYDRAPDYYAANVLTDRSIKPCLPYLTSRREQADRVRAAKSAPSSDAAPAPPPVRK